MSLATSAFVACTVATLLRRGDRRSLGHAMFLGVFGSMQLVDASLWWNEGHAALGLAGCDLANRVSTRVGLAIIYLEPMAAMLGAHVVAGKRAPSALIAAYAAIFLLTPLAGTSLLAENPNEPKSCEEAPAFAALGDQTRRPPAPSAPAPLLEQRDASSSSPGFASSQIGSGAPPRFGAANAEVQGLIPPAPVATCGFQNSWHAFLFDLDDPCVCSALTAQGHISYGGLDLVYHKALAPWDPVEPCRIRATGDVVEGSREIPLALRFLFLGAMALPYGALVTPRKAGAAHAGILTATWLVGASSDAAASVWCLANVAQGLLMLAEPAIWPEEFDDQPPPPPPPVSSVQSPSRVGEKSPKKSPKKRRGGTIARAVRGEDEGRGFDTDESPAVTRISRFKNQTREIAGRRWPRLDKAAATKLASDPRGFDAIVVGSGVGGLACAACLAKFGDKRVLVLESHYRAGGCTHSFNEVGDGVDFFDTGIHYVGMGKTLRWLISRVSGAGHAPMRFAAMGDVHDGYAYDVIDLGARPRHKGRGRGRGDGKAGGGPSGWGALDCVNLDCAVDDATDDDATDDDDDDDEERVIVTLRKDRLIESLLEAFPGEAEGIRAYVEDVRLGASRFTERTDSGAAWHQGAAKWFRFPAFNPGLDALMAGKLVPVRTDSAPGGILARVLAAVCRRLFKKAEIGARESAAEVVSKYVSDPAAIAALAAGQMIDWNLPPGKVAWPVAAGMMSYYDRGGYYPVGGSAQIAESIADAIESRHDSRVLCNARVDRVLVTESGGHRAYGVKVNGVEVYAPIVVSACGFLTTFRDLIPGSAVRDADLASGVAGVARRLRPSHGHVCAYVSLDGSSEALGLKPANVHSFPEDFGTRWGFDVDALCEAFYADPLGTEPLVTLTSPSAKDAWYRHRTPDRSNALLLVEGLSEWFEPFEDERWGRRSDGYRAFKSKFKKIFLDRLHRHYPKTRGRVTHVELSTPLTAKHFIGAPGGASYGLEWTKEHFDATFHERYFSPVVAEIPGMYLTGEAIAFGGFYGALVNGVVTASHVIGLGTLLAGMLGDKDAVWPLVYEDGETPPEPEPEPEPTREPAEVGSKPGREEAGRTREG